MFSSALLLCALMMPLLLQGQQIDCRYTAGPFLTLELDTLKGSYMHYDDKGFDITYTPCQSGLECFHNSVDVHAMVDGHPSGINECFYLAQWDATVQPFYDAVVGSWVFNYSNGEPCNDPNLQLNTSIRIVYTCNPDATHPFIADSYHYDSCNTLMEIQWEGACNAAPPPNQRCEFKSGFKSLNLSTVQGKDLSIADQHNNVWHLTPCANNQKCLTSHGTMLSVMSDILDPTGQCIKFLGVWSGDSFPFYDHTIFGQSYWDFFWMNGEECGEGGPLEVLNARYYCDPAEIGAEIVLVRGNGPCSFLIEIATYLACDNATAIAEAHNLN